MAFACAPASLTENSQFLRPITLGRMAFSAGLLSISIRPSFKKAFNPSPRFSVYSAAMAVEGGLFYPLKELLNNGLQILSSHFSSFARRQMFELPFKLIKLIAILYANSTILAVSFEPVSTYMCIAVGKRNALQIAIQW